jgi:hypothetical protein
MESAKHLFLETPNSEMRGVLDRGYLPLESWIGVGLRSVVSDFLVLHPVFSVRIF